MTENERREAEYRSILKMAGVAWETLQKEKKAAEEKPAKKQSKGKK